MDQIGSVLIAILGLIYYWKIESSALKLLIIYFVVAAAASLLGEIFAAQLGNNIFLYHFYSIAEFIVLGRAFGLLFQNEFSKRRFNLIFWMLLFTIICNSLFIQGLDQFNSIASTAISCTVIVASILYFNLSLSNPFPSPEMVTIKWFLIGIFVYHAVTVVVLLFSNLLHNLESLNDIVVWAFRAVVVVLTKLVSLLALLNLIYKKHFKLTKS